MFVHRLVVSYYSDVCMGGNVECCRYVPTYPHVLVTLTIAGKEYVQTWNVYQSGVCTIEEGVLTRGVY